MRQDLFLYSSQISSRLVKLFCCDWKTRNIYDNILIVLTSVVTPMVQ